MGERVLNPHWGLLGPEKIAEGINAARQNAARLAADARLMLDGGRTETAAALAILAIEESGKDSLLRELALAEDAREAKACWKRLRSHTAKNAMWVFPDFVARGGRRLDDFAALFDPSSDHTEVLDKLKQISIYSDCYGDAHWHRPAGAIGEDLARHLVTTAEIFCKRREATTREIELWVEHMRPVWRRNVSWQRKALANWHKQMQEEGLVLGGANDMATFIWGPEEK